MIGYFPLALHRTNYIDVSYAKDNNLWCMTWLLTNCLFSIYYAQDDAATYPAVMYFSFFSLNHIQI
jgi:hypothetical protein